MAEIMAEGYPSDHEEWLVRYLLSLIIGPMPEAERHKFLKDLIKRGMN